jgi:hypothetical protein
MGGLLAGVALLDREAADIVGPVGNARHREIDSGRDLVAKIIPARGDVARPQAGAGALDAAEARAGEDERPRVRTILDEVVVDALDMDERVGVEQGRARTERGRAHPVRHRSSIDRLEWKSGSSESSHQASKPYGRECPDLAPVELADARELYGS